MSASVNRFRALLTHQLAELEAEIKRLKRRPGDAETLHRTRVSSRRMREASRFLRYFSDRKKAGKFIRELREVTRQLSACRSLDVSAQILSREFLKKYPRAVRSAMARFKRQRVLQERSIRRLLSHLETSAWMRRLEGLLKGLDEAFQKRWASAKTKTLERRKSEIGRLLKKDLSRTARLHRVRISIKKLRYHLEVLGAVEGRKVGDSVRWLKKRQARLGRWHDLAALKELLSREPKKIMTPSRRKETERLLDDVSRACAAAEKRLVKKLKQKRRRIRHL